MHPLTNQEIRIGFREMTQTGDKFQKKLGLAGLYADDHNRARIYLAFKAEVHQYFEKSKQTKGEAE